MQSMLKNNILDRLKKTMVSIVMNNILHILSYLILEQI